jgi:hypothetical protein
MFSVYLEVFENRNTIAMLHATIQLCNRFWWTASLVSVVPVGLRVLDCLIKINIKGAKP